MCVCRLCSGADLETNELAHGETGIRQHLGHGELVVFRVVLLQQSNLLHERGETPLDDLRKGSLRLALPAADLLDDATLVLDVCRGNVFAAEVLRVCEGDVLGHAASSVSVITGVSDDDTNLRRQVL